MRLGKVSFNWSGKEGYAVPDMYYFDVSGPSGFENYRFISVIFMVFKCVLNICF